MPDQTLRALERAALMDPSAEAAAAHMAQMIRRVGRDPRHDPRAGDLVAGGRSSASREVVAVWPAVVDDRARPSWRRTVLAHPAGVDWRPDPSRPVGAPLVEVPAGTLVDVLYDGVEEILGPTRVQRFWARLPHLPQPDSWAPRFAGDVGLQANSGWRPLIAYEEDGIPLAAPPADVPVEEVSWQPPSLSWRGTVYISSRCRSALAAWRRWAKRGNVRRMGAP